MKTVIVMLSIHPLGDNRISKYEASLSGDYGYKVYNIHFLPLQDNLADYRYIIPISGSKIKKRLMFLFCQRYLLSKVETIISSFLNVVFIIHDPIILSLAKKLKKLGGIIVYDRHEYYENLKTKNIIAESFLYERLFIKYTHYLICVSQEHLHTTQTIFSCFSDENTLVIHNYPARRKLMEKDLLKNVKPEIPMISYIGSMNWKLDRDIQLMIDCIVALEKKGVTYKCVFGGKVFDSDLLDRLLSLQQQTSGRFEYIGYISRDEAVSITVRSHIGFLFLYPTYTHIASPNKLFEYIYYGVIPFTRFNYSGSLDTYNRYMYGFEDTNSVIVDNFVKLVSDMKTIETYTTQIIDAGCPFVWENDIKKLLKWLPNTKAENHCDGSDF